MTSTRQLLATAAVATALLVTGCAGVGQDSSTSAGSPASVEQPADEGGTDGGRADDLGAPDALDAVADDTGAGAGKAPGDGPVALQEQALISTATVSLETEDVADARFEVRKIIDRAGGKVTEQETTTDDDGELDTARLVMRVPSGRFTPTVDAVEKVGALTGSTTGSQDVTTKVIDVAARIRSQEKSVRRIESLLARATTLGEIISIESDLARRQADLDSLKSRRAYLADQTSLSTITVHIERADDPGTPPEEETRDGFLAGLEAGWDSFVSALVVASTALGYLLPWLLPLAVVGLPLLLWLRSRRGRRPAPPAHPAQPAAAGQP